ncbi:hypothetical protein CDL12_18204 [Handroanthus impetiginosus]|uniref:Uncharacterized protein n=1 Tax=Handroanthus impetiginosus TaxID=429701 RepID=A0A2G9GW25_9LAMI|nr:hypothetical protein CDL12_18204 [Handroanthus impetiginosus]
MTNASPYMRLLFQLMTSESSFGQELEQLRTAVEREVLKTEVLCWIPM